MKVLVIGLLRLGDFIQTLPVLYGLRAQYNILKLDVLTFEPTKMLHPMLPIVDRWWTLDRDGLQEGLGRADIPMLTSLSVLKEQLEEIDSQRYDAVINLTQTRFSAWIAGYLHTANRTGLALDVRGYPHFHSPWFQYLDDHATVEAKDVFHYTDIFFYGCGLKGSERTWRLKETARGRDEAEPYACPTENIVLQTLTSDAKKNWSEDSWLKTMSLIQLFRPNANLILLGAPNEEARVNSLLDRAQAAKLRVSKAIISLEGALSLLKNAKLLISGDTSIKHLAQAAEIPILELSMGSSDFRRTGSYRADSLILQANVGCAPCPHSSPCSKATHECAIGIAPEAVASSAHHLLTGDWDALKKIAGEYESELRFLRTRNLDSGFWLAKDILDPSPEALIETIVERCTWKFMLNREYMNPVAQYGSEGLRMHRELEGLLPGEALESANAHLNFLEKEAAERSEQVGKMWQNAPQPPERKGGIVEIGGVRRMQNQLEKVFYQSNVKLKLIRSLKSQLSGAK